MIATHVVQSVPSPESNQASEWQCPREKLSLVVACSSFGRKVVMVYVLGIRGICYYKILAENKTMLIINAARYLL